MADIKQLIPQKVKNIYHLIAGITAVTRFGFPSKNLTIIGVTGTDGKTTTSTLIYHILNKSGIKTALISTVAAYIGKEEIQTGFHVTSPDPYPLQQLLHKIKNSDINTVVLEATSHGLDQHRLFGTNIQVGVLTNITNEHLDYHKSMNRYIKAKSKLFKSAHTAILNSKDSNTKKISKLIPRQIKIINYSPKKLPNSVFTAIRKHFPETYNHQNSAAAYYASKTQGVTDDQFIKAIKTFPGIPGRMQKIQNDKGINLIVDFAHTPNAVKNVLSSLKKQTKGKLIAVYGSAGLRDYTKRPLMGKIGAALADEIILTAEDPRTESIWKIIDQMCSRININIGHIHKIPDRQEAINFAISIAKSGDSVVVLGKGHEQSMNLDGKTETPWSDAQALQKAVKKVS